MSGSLAYSKGVLYVGTEARTARVRSFDLDGRELEVDFTFGGESGRAASALGLDIDEDHRLWVADGVGERLLAFTLFGDRVAGVEAAAGRARDKRGVLGRAIDVVSRGSDDAQELLVASSGRRRHAVQLLPLGGGAPQSLRSGGHVDVPFQDVRGIAWRERFAWVCEREAGRVQVFRDLDYHFEFRVQPSAGARFRPNAIQPLPDGRLVVAQGGAASALLLLDARGRLLSMLAGHGAQEGALIEPNDVAVAPGEDDRHTRVVVIDGEGARIQVFNLEGDCYGTFPGFARSVAAWEPTESTQLIQNDTDL